MQVIKTDYSVRLRALQDEKLPERWAIDNSIWRVEPDITPHVRMYYQDSPLRRRVDSLLEDLRQGELELAEAELDSLPNVASMAAKRRLKTSEAVGAMIGAMIRGYIGP